MKITYGYSSLEDKHPHFKALIQCAFNVWRLIILYLGIWLSFTSIAFVAIPNQLRLEDMCSIFSPLFQIWSENWSNVFPPLFLQWIHLNRQTWSRLPVSIAKKYLYWMEFTPKFVRSWIYQWKAPIPSENLPELVTNWSGSLGTSSILFAL